MTSQLTPDLLERFAKRVEADPTARMMQNALARTDVDKVVQDHAQTLLVATLDEPPAGRLGGHRPEAVRPVLDVRRA